MGKLIRICDITKPEKYTNKDNQDKVKWYKVGTFREYDDGKMFIKIHILGEDFLVFEQQKKKEIKKK